MTGPQDTGTDTGEMLELIAKVTANLSDRMDEQGNQLTAIRSYAVGSFGILQKRPPKPAKDDGKLQHELTEARQALGWVSDSLADADHRAKDAWQRLEAKTTEQRGLLDARDTARAKLRTWKRAILFAIPVVVLLLALILPTLLARHPLSCKAMAGTWHIEEGKAYCFFRRTAP